ncbi:hypothetical protein [Enterococcus sp. 1001283B150225_161107_E12]|uniref:hypothetical protein n=1 Tax=Enterococcus sp. 1001283B150225_161107_E12 TaxID=2787145 RepID=UPI00189EDB80|nr:hypothetical protein [Enterococcus sp. 1001283B150225_161107_E12]
MPTLFPDNYEKANIAKRKKLARNLKLKNELSALDIALHAHDTFNYLVGNGVEQPNSIFVSLFQYAAEALGVPYEIIDEAFFTQTPLSEEELFDLSYLFNPNAQIIAKQDLPIVPITIDFYSMCLALFEELPASFWKEYVKAEAILPETKLDAYDLEKLLQAFVQQVWLKTKESIGKPEGNKIEKARQMFLACFYRNDQKFYRKETQDMLLGLLENKIAEQVEEDFVIDAHLQKLLDEGDSNSIYAYVIDHLTDWLDEKNYQRFLRSIPKTKNLSLMNQLLLLYQRVEAVESKEVHDWIRENRTLKNNAEPVFLFGGNQQKVNSETGEILKEKQTQLTQITHAPIVPYFEKKETQGKEETKKIETSPKEVFAILEKIANRTIVFEEREESILEDHTIRIKSNQGEEQTLADLIICLLEKEKRSADDIIRFENESIASIVMIVFGFNPVPLNLSLLTQLRSMNNGKVKLQQLFTDLIVRSDTFLQKIAAHMYEKETELVRPTLEEEIRRARELQSRAMENVATDKANKKEERSEEDYNLADTLEKLKGNSESSEDDKTD